MCQGAAGEVCAQAALLLGDCWPAGPAAELGAPVGSGSRGGDGRGSLDAPGIAGHLESRVVVGGWYCFRMGCFNQRACRFFVIGFNGSFLDSS